MRLYFCCVSVLGKVPADLLLLLTTSTSAPPDLGETVIVSASALNGSAGCFRSTQPVYVYLFFCQPPHCRGPIAKLEAFSSVGSLSFSLCLCVYICISVFLWVLSCFRLYFWICHLHWSWKKPGYLYPCVLNRNSIQGLDHLPAGLSPFLTISAPEMVQNLGLCFYCIPSGFLLINSR